VPSGKLASPPCIHTAGGICAEKKILFEAGSCARRDQRRTNSATRSSKATTAPPSHSRGPPRLSAAIHGEVRSDRSADGEVNHCASLGSSERDQNIDDKIEGDEENSKGQDQSLDQGEIRGLITASIAILPIPLIGEDAFDQHRSAKQQGDLNAAGATVVSARSGHPPQQDRRPRKSPRSCYLRVIL